MSWDDLRFVLALARAGSLLGAAKSLGVDHTTVGRRVEAAEAALRVRLFTRTTAGVTATADAERLLAPIRQVEEAVLSVERVAHAQGANLTGTVRVTAPETFGASYLAPIVSAFGRQHPGLVVELVASGEVLDLGRQKAQLAVRNFRSKQQNLVVRRAAQVAYGLYGAESYLAHRPVKSKDALKDHPILGSPEEDAIESAWLRRLHPRAEASFVSVSSIALLSAARAGAGLAVLPRYLGDAEPTLRRVPMPNEPVESMWLTIHRDLKETPRVRALFEALVVAMKADEGRLLGR